MAENTYTHTSKYALRIAPSQIPGAGFGVFTDTEIPADSLIDEYTGTYKDHGGLYALELGPKLYIDADVWPRCYMGIINDCSYIAPQYKRRKGRRIDITPGTYYDSKGQPLKINCEFRVSETEKKAWVYSTTTIPTGSELFISYGDDYWK
jgi:hypothetical protein